jgi:5-deoxy-D-glucuronate isomerase
MTLFNILEDRAESGKGSKKGREKYTSREGAKGKGAVKSGKSRVRIFATIAKALEHGHVGQVFSTKGSDRLYVVSKAGWGKKSSGKIAKGFTPGSSTPSSDWKSVKAHAVRTALKHGKTKNSRLMNKYGPGAKNKIKNSKKTATQDS